ncbi:tRNA lysidine(34) synthetase TilS [Aestuariibacter salexigens]|uniref:tRNA lysidine(34) synthetase TilS n=1 Tax=Aestuariibacter salexigens TaxID=226010 RepID=UPI0003F9D30B|nr:tRNA lysidine(34) synthetase TilS [Aestuariibacter salexigens]
MDLLRHLQDALDSFAGSPIYVAYSGGLDSQALLYACYLLRREGVVHDLHAIHVNHGLSKNSATWQQHCKSQCDALDVPLVEIPVQVAQAARISIESAARDARYDAFERVLPDHALLLLAHHADDQLETFLLQLKRGAGPKGLSAMPAQLNWSQGRTVVRPWLACNREDIRQFADFHALQWQEDESNANERFERNFIRHQITPLLRQRWPSITRTVSRSAMLCAEQQALLDDVVNEKLANMQGEDGAVCCQKLSAVTPAWQRQLVRAWLQEQAIKAPPKALLERLDELLDAKPDANPILQWQHWQLRRYQQRLYVIDSRQCQKMPTVPLQCVDGLTLFNGAFSLRTSGPMPEYFAHAKIGQVNEALVVERGQQQRPMPVRKWLKGQCIPPWWRETYPVISIEKQAIAFINQHGDIVFTGEHEYQAALTDYLTVLRSE